ncbi:DUF3313 domain-containing protein [Acidisoma sp. L85]|uniref:DUF3313 domain-containing protein n=1 Tax=Acidisoma sp. L85 TaxID=1641850 RepID=UPI00131DAB1B|nr:DUF3313 domain-containing protein [Acidisoma sp. L85]
MSRTTQWIAVAACLVTLGGCQQKATSGLQTGQVVGGATEQMAVSVPANGFLPSPQLLTPGASGQADFTYLNTNVQPPSYTAVMVDPVTIWADPASSLNSATPGQRQQLANLASSDLRNAMKQVCPLAHNPGPGVLVLRVALIDATSANPVVNTIATYTPYASTAYDLAAYAFNKDVGYFAGTATAEAYAVDGGNGAVVWQAVSKRGGTSAAIKDTLNQWLDVQHAFQAWSTQLATRFQSVGFCQNQG